MGRHYRGDTSISVGCSLMTKQLTSCDQEASPYSWLDPKVCKKSRPFHSLGPAFVKPTTAPLIRCASRSASAYRRKVVGSHNAVARFAPNGPKTAMGRLTSLPLFNQMTAKLRGCLWHLRRERGRMFVKQTILPGRACLSQALAGESRRPIVWLYNSRQGTRAGALIFWFFSIKGKELVGSRQRERRELA